METYINRRFQHVEVKEVDVIEGYIFTNHVDARNHHRSKRKLLINIVHPTYSIQR